MKKRISQCFKNFQWKEVIKLSRQYLLANETDYTVEFYLATALLNIGDLDNAESKFITIAKNYPDKYQGFEGLAKIYRKKGDIELSMAQWLLIIEKFPDIKHAYNNLGLLFIEKKRFNYARCVFEDLISKHPEYPLGYVGLIKLQEISEYDQGELRVKLRKAFKQFPHSDDIQKIWIEFEIKDRDFEWVFDHYFTRNNEVNLKSKALTFLAEQAEVLKFWNRAYILWHSAIQQDKNNQINRYHLGRTLRHTQTTEQMFEYFREEAEKMPDSYVLHKGLVEAANLSQKWQSVIEAIDKAKTFCTPGQMAELYLLGRIAYMETKQLDRLDQELTEFLEKHPEWYKAWKVYATIPALRYNGNSKDLLLAIERSIEVVKRFPHVIEARSLLGQNYLANSQAEEAEVIYSDILKDHPDNMSAWKFWASCPVYQENWAEAIDRMRSFQRKFPSSFLPLFYAYIYALYQQGNYEMMKNEYVSYIGRYFRDELNSNPYWFMSERQKIDSLFSLKSDRDLPYTLNQIQDRIDSLPIINMDRVHRFMGHNPNSDVLVVCFSGMDGKRTNELYQELGQRSFQAIADYKPNDNYDFMGFAKKTVQYNFLLLRDNYNCWYQIHTQMYIDTIKRVMKEYNLKKLVCIGTSAGGYAALFFGQLLKADLVFTYGAQTMAWTNHGSKYHKACEITLNAGSRYYNNIGQLQRDAGGFIPKVYAHFGKNCLLDLFSQLVFDEADANLHIIRHDTDKHTLHQVIGKRSMFTDICQKIDMLSEC